MSEADADERHFVAAELVEQGLCTAMCLLAESSDQKCTCPCNGEGHGALAMAEVEFDPSGVIADPPMREAPEFDCHNCHRRIGKAAAHVLVDEQYVLCTGCMGSNTKHLHSHYYSDCPSAWHDMWDHRATHGTRAAVAALLGIWPRARENPAQPEG